MTGHLPLVDATAKPITADDLRARLRAKFTADQYAMLYEVRDAAGHRAKRSADVIMVGLWPSRGCQIEGMELKVSRGDWLRELQRPDKAEAFVPYCDRWWIVAADASVVTAAELPKSWGLMVCAGQRLKVITPAPQLKPRAVNRELLAAMLKRATDTAADNPEVQARIDARLATFDEELARRVEQRTHSLRRDADELRERVKKFEEASGVQIDTYNSKQIGEAVRMVVAGEHEWRLKELQRMKESARHLVAWFDTNVPDPPAAGTPP